MITMRVSSGRRLLTGLALAAAAVGLHAAEPAITVYKSPTCGCCTEWADHLRKHGFAVDTVDSLDLSRIKAMSGVKPELASCHTAFVNGYVIEGHVPADDIRRLLADKPDARGLTVPGMPAGSPGMESPTPEHYQVLLIDKAGKTTVFATH
jgi:hypothetical protein